MKLRCMEQVGKGGGGVGGVEEGAGVGGGGADHSNEVVLEGEDEGGAVHAGEEGEGKPQQHPLHLLLPHAQGLPIVQA